MRRMHGAVWSPSVVLSRPHHQPVSSPCLLYGTPLTIHLPQFPALQLGIQNCHPFRKFNQSDSRSEFLCVAWATRIHSKRLMRALITKSKPLDILFCSLADISIRLGHIGDQAFALVMTDLIQDRYPYLRVGPASVRLCAVIRLGSCLSW